MGYTRVDLVSAYLNGLTINSTTTPSEDEVMNWIKEVEDYIDERTGQVWGVKTFTDEIFDYDGSGSIMIPYAPLLSITSLSYETEGLGADSASWSTLTEGRNNDFIVYTNSGLIKFFGSNYPSAGYQNIKVSGTYGRSSTPKRVQSLATKLVARKVIEAKVNSLARDAEGSVSVGNISLGDPSLFSVERLSRMDEEIERDFKTLAGFKFVGVNRRVV